MKGIIALALLAAVGIVVFGRMGQAEVYVGQRVRGTVPFERIDHSEWDRLLKTYVDADGMVDYGAWHTSKSDRESLERYLSHLSTGDPSSTATSNAQLAFWINAYNAVTIHGILREYPTSSIRNHTATVVGYNIWKHLQLYVNRKPYSLNQIEHGILRKKNDPRIHFAIVCASVSCPRLLNEAYTANRIQDQLDTNARDFFGRSRNFRHDGEKLQLSSILKWFDVDFGASQTERLQKIAKWLPNDRVQQAVESGRVKVRYLDYDWNLNEQR